MNLIVAPVPKALSWKVLKEAHPGLTSHYAYTTGP